MTKTTLSRALLLAGIVAAAGAAQAAGTYDTPQQAGEASTMTMGAPNLLTTNSPYGDSNVIVDTTVLGAAPMTVVTPSVVTMTTYYPPPVVVSSDSDTVVTRIFRPEIVDRNAAAATFDVPSRAGEASTMTGGAPNMVTSNERVILSSRAPVVIHSY